MNAKEFKNEIKIHIEARYPVLWLVSFEERRVEKLRRRASRKGASRASTRSASSGLYSGEKKKWEALGREKVLTTIDEKISKSQNENNIFLLKDISGYFHSHEFLRKFRDLPAIIDEIQPLNTVCILSPTLTEIPPELDEDIVVIELSLPDYEEIEEMVITTFGKLIPEKWYPSTRAILYKSLQGLSMDNIRRVVRKAITRNNGKLTEDCISFIQEEKQQVIKKQKTLDYYTHKETIEHIGGLGEIKKWFIEREHVFRLSKERIDTLGLDIPRGLLLIGVPGSGKSLCCKALAGIWNLPLLRLDVGRLFGSTVGESEKNIRKCIQLAEAVSPCILWIDEIDKAFGTFVTWLQEKEKPVFVIATANEPKNLPPELWRKGRYDEVFFVDLPSVEEREEIFKIHMESRGQKTIPADLREYAQNSHGYTGAEIEQAVKDSIVTTFNRIHEGKMDEAAEEMISELSGLDVNKATVLASIRSITPLSILKKEEIDELRKWSHRRARPASRSLFLQRVENLGAQEKRNIAIHEASHTVMMWHHFRKTPVFISLDTYKDYTVYLPHTDTLEHTFTKKELEKEIGIILAGMVAEEEIIGNDSKTVGASHDLIAATVIARRMVVEFGFGDIIKNTSLIALQDFALTSGKEIFDDVQRILENAKAETEAVIKRNLEVIMSLVKELEKDVLLNGEALLRFFSEHQLEDKGKD